MELQVIVHEAEDGSLWAESPQLPGCFAAGDTEEELRACLLEAIELWLEDAEPVAVKMESFRYQDHELIPA